MVQVNRIARVFDFLGVEKMAELSASSPSGEARTRRAKKGNNLFLCGLLLLPAKALRFSDPFTGLRRERSPRFRPRFSTVQPTESRNCPVQPVSFVLELSYNFRNVHARKFNLGRSGYKVVWALSLLCERSLLLAPGAKSECYPPTLCDLRAIKESRGKTTRRMSLAGRNLSSTRQNAKENAWAR